MRRRDFLTGSAGVAASLMMEGLSQPAEGQVGDWDAGEVAHILPSVSHDRFLIKVSFRTPASGIPLLRLGRRLVPGKLSDRVGRFWAFYVAGLEPMTSYRLELLSDEERPLCQPWFLGTFPPPDSLPDRFRLLIFTCAGGHEDARLADGTQVFLSLDDRRRLLRRALSFQPQAAMAVGDHVYWDMRAGRSASMVRESELAKELDASAFRRELPVLGSENEGRLVGVVDPQIADLYGSMLRSVPSYFVLDDHDYFENDHADDEIVTFPPDPFMLQLAQATQRLYYPELLPDSRRPLNLGGGRAFDSMPGLSESFGTLRFGRLVEGLIYDCRRFLSLKGPSAGFVPEATESWLLSRMAAAESRHVVNIPSTPVGWSAGKWAEWYPDLLQPDGRLGTSVRKPYWQEGWLAQHDRLLRGAAAMADTPLFVSGDLHALGVGRILGSATLDLSHNPVVSVLSGPLGTGPPGWPSASRGTGPQVPTGLDLEEDLAPVEKNGFTLLDFGLESVTIRMFQWKLGEDPSLIDDLEPFLTLEV